MKRNSFAEAFTVFVVNYALVPRLAFVVLLAGSSSAMVVGQEGQL